MKTNLPVTQVEVPFPKGRYIVSRTDLKGIITYGNDTFFDISGFMRDEMIGNSHNMVRHPDMPPQAFEDLWRTVKAGRPWRGLVKNRSKNGDYYWVEALVVPVRKDNQTIGYMSVRTEPSRQQVVEAEDLYRKLKSNQANLPKPSKWMGISLDAKLTGLILWLLVAQLIGTAAHLLGPTIDLSQTMTDRILEFLGITSIAAGIWLLTMKTQIMTIIGRIVGRLDHIAQGDLTDAIPLDRVDELGKLNDNLVTMQTHLKSMLAEIAEAANGVGRDATVLTAEMNQTRNAADLQSSAVSRIAAAVEQLVVSVHEVTDSAQVAAQSVEASRVLLNDASTRMVESQQASQNVVTTVKNAEQTMAELFQSISAIGRITQAIKEIADQTNLLALNAAIEAARAGEQGRGFAVVADEVRKLAGNATTQTAEISASVDQIQHITQVAVSGMGAAGAHVSTTDTAMNKAREGLDSVIHHGEEVEAISQKIADQTRQQSSAGDEIAVQVQDIMTGIERTSAAIAEVNQMTEQMKGTSLQLQQLIGYFRYIR
ncbi:MAG: PAS domain-containing methyl-accepting chemotaxis protein [Sterolibacterium sp.]|nr:PAS domain-containing methyl-accepting chemotaxis protein [Sterolibacterium sp.]